MSKLTVLSSLSLTLAALPALAGQESTSPQQSPTLAAPTAAAHSLPTQSFPKSVIAAKPVLSPALKLPRLTNHQVEKPSSVDENMVATTTEVKSADSTVLSETPTTGFYFTGAVGANWPQATNVHELTNFFGQNYGLVENRYDGFSAEAGIGYDFGALRTELTYAYDGSSLANYSDNTGSYQYSGGSISKNSVFASLYWDVDLGASVVPYIGGGLGYSSLDVAASSDSLANYSGYNVGAFAYQAKLGLSYLVDRRSDIFVEGIYRGMAGYIANDGPISYYYGNNNSWGFQFGARVRF